MCGIEEIRKELFAAGEPAYRRFQCRLIPTMDEERIIGVRTPVLRKLAKRLSAGKKEGKDEKLEKFLRALPHVYFEEEQLHAFLIAEEKNFNVCIREVERFLPYVDNWATCDQMSPAIFRKAHVELLPHVLPWLDSSHPYTVRYGIGMLLQHFLGDDFRPDYLQLVAEIRSEEYYVRMMMAWYFATALALQYDAAVPYLLQKQLDPWVHRKTIQKAVESLRISKEKKDFLRTLRDF